MEKTLNLPVFRDKQFSNDMPEGIAYGFYTRQGGVSEGLYASLNCGPGSNDNPQAVHENRSRVAFDLGIQPENLLSLYQIHSDVCLSVDKPWNENRPQADAFVTDQENIALGVLTADCTPVLFYGEKKNSAPIIGAAHAGWRGALGGVLQSTVKSMLDMGLDMNTLRACIGPCIQKRSYEVSLEFQKEFILGSKSYEIFFQDGKKPDHPHFDLPGFCAYQLHQAGVQNISISNHDTYSREGEYFSYRRTTHKQEADYGRQISAIVIQS